MNVNFQRSNVYILQTLPPEILQSTNIRNTMIQVNLELLADSYTVKPVLRGHLWDKEKVAL